ncbi:hypothetical protein NQ314_004883 [Rhamnusium bicolor]|uniref:Reverse transcriptase n=1 Tax=Rhamnusium bicolor TaxID=1586634 RepID=A0AAV8ZKV5_9CUCU|nr:hypothetical protein NQ314_004883 [Rhamnusium bicolor]
MPNVGGPRASKRLLSCVVHSQMLYDAPIWYTVTEKKKLVSKLASVQRKIALRVCSAYRTISTEAAGVISGIPPIELQLLERREKYLGIDGETARANLITRRQDKWNLGTYGRWTHCLIPDIQTWADRVYGKTDYYLTQALSGHGCFRKYLFERRRVETDACKYCGEQDNAKHTLFVCSYWEEFRHDYHNEAGRPFNALNMMTDLINGREEDWKLAYKAWAARKTNEEVFVFPLTDQ